eukprot:Em0010g513a
MHHAMDLVVTDQAVLATEGKVADHVQEDTSTHLDGEIKEEGANDVETVGEGPSNSEHQDGVDEGPSDGVDEGPSDGVDEGPSDGVDEGPSDSVDEGPSDGVDEEPSGGVNDSVNEGPCDGVDERPSDEGPSDGPSDESDSSSVDDTDLAAGAIVVPDFKNNPDQDDIFATPWEKEHYLKYFPRQTRPSDSVVAQPQGETADMGETSEAIAAMQELFRNLLDEKKKREEEEARRREQERLEREEERKRLEAQWERERQEHIAEKERERQRREEDLRIRDQELRAQMELFAKMVESKKAESSSGASSRAADGELRVVKLADRDDIEAYLTTFERLMSAYNIPKDRWNSKLESK